MPSKNPDPPGAAAPPPVVPSALPAPPPDPAAALVASPSPPVAPEATDGGTDTIEAWAAQYKTSAFLFEGAKYLRRWGIGHRVTEAAYLQAVSDFANNKVG